MHVIRGDLDEVGGRPLDGSQPAPAIVGHVVAPGDVGVLIEGVEADRQGRADHLIDIQRHPLGRIGSEGGLRLGEVAVGRLLGHDVDGAARGAASGEGRSRSTQDFNLLGKEVFADADSGIADAVDEHVVAGVETADEEPVAERVAALAGSQRDAGRRARDVPQRGRILVVENFLAENRDRLGRVQQRFGEPCAGHPVDLVWRRRVGVGIAVSRQTAGIGKGHCRDLRRLRAPRGAAQCRAGAKRFRRGPRRGWTRAGDRGIDRHRREVGLLGFGAGKRGDRDQAGHRRNFPAGVSVNFLVDRVGCCDRTQRPRCFSLVHPTPLTDLQFRSHRSDATNRPRVVVSSEKFQVNAMAAAGWLNTSRSKRF